MTTLLHTSSVFYFENNNNIVASESTRMNEIMSVGSGHQTSTATHQLKTKMTTRLSQLCRCGLAVRCWHNISLEKHKQPPKLNFTFPRNVWSICMAIVKNGNNPIQNWMDQWETGINEIDSTNWMWKNDFPCQENTALKPNESSTKQMRCEKKIAKVETISREMNTHTVRVHARTHSCHLVLSSHHTLTHIRIVNYHVLFIIKKKKQRLCLHAI